MDRDAPTRPLTILVTGEPLGRVAEQHGSWADLVQRAAGEVFRGQWAVVDLRDGSALPELRTLSGVVITGSASSVTERASWMLRGEAYLRDLVAANVPTFGICFGHQMLGQALGGRVDSNPRGREIGTVDVEVIEPDDELMQGLVFQPAPGAFRPRANMTHVDTVAMLPPAARVLARTAKDPHAAVRFAPSAWGVQFHPEIDRDVMRIYLEERRELVRAEGGDPEGLLATVEDGAFGQHALRRFLEIARRD